MNRHPNKVIYHSSWEEIWNKFKCGDKQAFEIIYKEHIDFLYSYGTKMSMDPELVEGSIQDLFLYLLSKRDQITTPDNIRFYLLKAFKRILFEKARKEKVYSSGKERDYFDLSVEMDETGEMQLKEKKLELIESLVNELDARNKEILFLKFYSGLSYEEIAGIVGIKASSVKKLVYRIISSFRNVLQKKSLELFCIFYSKLRIR